MSRRLITNALSGASVPIVKAAITFIMAPVIVHSLGNHDYGIWEMVFAVVGYMGILDLGLMPAIVQGVSRHHAIGDREELQRIFSTALAYFLPLGLLFMFLILLLIYAFPGTFGDGVLQNDSKYSIFFSIIAVQVMFTFIGGVFDGYLEGLQKYTLRNGLTIIFSVLGAILLYPLLKSGGGLIALALVNAVGFSLKYTVYGILLLLPAYGRLRFRLHYVSFQTLKRLLHFGIKSFIYAISLRVTQMTDSLVVGAFLGPVAVTFYVIPVNLLNHARNLIHSASRSFMPAFSVLNAQTLLKESQTLLFNSSRIALGIILPFLAGILLLGPAFISTWMGEQYAEEGRYVLFIMTGACLAQWLNPLGNRFLTGLGQHAILARLGVYNAVLNLGLSILLVLMIGKEGVALGTLFPLMILEPFLLHKTCCVSGERLGAYLKQVLLPLIIPLTIFIISVVTLKSLLNVNTLISILSLCAIATFIYIPVFIWLVLLPHERIYFFQNIRRKATYLT